MKARSTALWASRGWAFAARPALVSRTTVVLCSTEDSACRRAYQLPKRDLTPQELLIKWYDYYDCNMGYSISADKVARILKLAGEHPNPKYTTRDRVGCLIDRATDGTVYSWNSIVSFLHGQGWIDEAFTIFERMKEEDIVPNLMSFNSLINCHLARQDFQNAGLVLEDMRKEGLSPNIVSYATLFKGLADTNQLSAMKLYLPAAQKDKIDPTFLSEIEALVQQNNAAAISQKAGEAIHKQLTAEEMHPTKEGPAMK